MFSASESSIALLDSRKSVRRAYRVLACGADKMWESVCGEGDLTRFGDSEEGGGYRYGIQMLRRWDVWVIGSRVSSSRPYVRALVVLYPYHHA